MLATITSKGQITVPKYIRDKLRLHTGDKMDFFLTDDGHVEMVPKKCSMKELKGIFPPRKKNVTNQQMRKAIAKGAQRSAGH